MELYPVRIGEPPVPVEISKIVGELFHHTGDSLLCAVLIEHIEAWAAAPLQVLFKYIVLNFVLEPVAFKETFRWPLHDFLPLHQSSIVIAEFFLISGVSQTVRYY